MPLLFFSLLYIPSYIFQCVSTGQNISLQNILVSNLIYSANAPLWFLKTLLWVFVIYAVLYKIVLKLIKGVVWRYALLAMCALSMAVLGKYMPTSGFLLSIGLSQAVLAYPLLFLGSLIGLFLQSYENINMTKTKQYFILLCSVVIWLLTANDGLRFHNAEYDANISVFYISSAISFLSLVIMFRVVPIPILEYYGRNSLIVLGVHQGIITVLHCCGITFPWYVLSITLLLLVPVTWLLRRYLPSLCGVKYMISPTPIVK